MEQQPVHSPLGASGAERWMNCSGSVALLKQLNLGVSDEADFQREGIAAHEVGAYLLRDDGGRDTWEVIGETFHNTQVDAKMGTAIQLYLDTVRPIMAVADKSYVEYRVSHPMHRLCYGTVDFGAVLGKLLDVTDYKNGVLLVEVEYNPQLMYYAGCLLREHPECETVRIRVVQPNGFHSDGPVRVWEVSAAYIYQWMRETLLPAMNHAEMDDGLNAGPWCRFCPAKLVCPLMTSLFGAACTSNPKHLVNWSDAAVGRSYQYIAAVKFYLNALEADAMRRLSMGKTIEGIKLVHKKANRVWKEGALDALREALGPEAELFEPGALKSPAQIELLGSTASQKVKELAYTPVSGLTVALASDKRVEIKVKSSSETFATQIQEYDNG